jgi:hypothetical protein
MSSVEEQQENQEQGQLGSLRKLPSLLTLSPKIPAYIIGVPRCHENLFQIVRDNHKWLSTGGESRNAGREKVFLKKINTLEEFEQLEGIIKALRTVNSELFIDSDYHPKPLTMRLEDYIAEFLKNKSVGNHYTFKTFYRVTVYPFGFDYDQPLPDPENEPERRIIYENTMAERRDYLIVPLYIILKKGKTYDQMKSLSYNDDGSFNVHRVNHDHFWKMYNDEEEKNKDENKEEEEQQIINVS